MNRLNLNDMETTKTIQTEDIIFQDNNRTARAYVCFCDGELCVSVTDGDKQFDFGLDPLTLKMLVYGYKLHCEECERANQVVSRI